VFLDPITLTKKKSAYVRFTNTSDFQDLDIQQLLKQNLATKGIEVVTTPTEETYILQANLLYLGEQKDGMTYEGMLAGGFGGALLGASMAGNRPGNVAQAGLAGAVIGTAAGALIGSAFKVSEYLGSLDIQIKEPVEGKVTGTQTASLQNGSSTSTVTNRDIETSWQEYRTRIVVSARQTNIDREQAVTLIANRLSDQVAGFFAN
jgi:hypothetical protein